MEETFLSSPWELVSSDGKLCREPPPMCQMRSNPIPLINSKFQGLSIRAHLQPSTKLSQTISCFILNLFVQDMDSGYRQGRGEGVSALKARPTDFFPHPRLFFLISPLGSVLTPSHRTDFKVDPGNHNNNLRLFTHLTNSPSGNFNYDGGKKCILAVDC